MSESNVFMMCPFALVLAVGCQTQTAEQVAAERAKLEEASAARKAAEEETPRTQAKPPAAKAEEPPKQAKGPFPESADPRLRDPSKLTEKAPDKFKVAFDTTAGSFVIECTREWAPHGVDRIYNLVRVGFFDDIALFRVVKGFVVQFGIHGNPEVSKAWSDAQLPVDEPKQSNKRGTVTFAMAGAPTTRTTQLFINFGDNGKLDKMGFAPACEVSDGGMGEVEKIHAGYGEKPSGAQGKIQSDGNKFLREKFPELDYVKTARLLGVASVPAGGKKAAGSAEPSAPKP